MKVRFSCVVDQPPKYAEQALIWLCSLMLYGGAESSSVVVHTVGECDAAYARLFGAWGVDIRQVAPFDTRHPYSNKLRQLENAWLGEADYVVLCDCDTVFCDEISPWLESDSVRARVASRTGLRADQWEAVFKAAGVILPRERVTALQDGGETLPSYCNGGVYIIPQALFHQLAEAWPRWDRWLLERQELVRPYVAFIDQIAFALSCEELSLSVDHLSLEMNFDGVTRVQDVQRVMGRQELSPRVLHYHGLDRGGLLRLTEIPSVNRQIGKINNMIRLGRRVGFDPATLMLLAAAGGRRQ